jgi:hypothetical protein
MSLNRHQPVEQQSSHRSPRRGLFVVLFDTPQSIQLFTRNTGLLPSLPPKLAGQLGEQLFLPRNGGPGLGSGHQTVDRFGAVVEERLQALRKRALRDGSR